MNVPDPTSGRADRHAARPRPWRAARSGLTPVGFAGMAALQAAAYLAVLEPMGFGFNRFHGLELAKYQLNTVVNAFAAPLVVALAVVLLRSLTAVIAVHAAQAVTLVGVSLYYRYFEAVPHVAMLREVGVLPAVGHHIMVQLFGAREALVLAALAASCVIACRMAIGARRHARPRAVIAALFIGLALFAVKDAALATRLPIAKYRYDGVYFLKRYGFVPIVGAQIIGEIRPRAHNVAWPGPLAPEPCDAPVFPRSDADVIMVQVESLDTWVVDWEVAGRPVMPFLHDFAAHSMSYSNFFAQHRGGGSSDAELSILTGLLPLGSHTGYLTADFRRIISLPEIFAARGYYSCALHANSKSYFYRGTAYQRLGFDDFFDRASFAGKAAGWFSQDAAFFAQSLALLDRAPHPTFAYVITMQSHGPFENHAPDTGEFEFPADETPIVRDYILTMHEVDAALAALVRGLERRGRLDRTLLVVYADHQPGVRPAALPPPREESGDRDRIPLFIHWPALGSGVSAKVGSHIDLGPTVLALLGAPRVEFSFGAPLTDPGPGHAFISVRGAMVVVRNAGDGSGRIVASRDLGPFRRAFEYSQSVLDP